MLAADIFATLGLQQLGASVLAHHLLQTVAPFFLWLSLSNDRGLVHQPRQRLQHLAGFQTVPRTYRLGGFQRASACKA